MTLSTGNRGSCSVGRWRCELLVAAGFGRVLAAEIAADPRWDVHRLIELSERGCPPELAVRILAPLEAGG